MYSGVIDQYNLLAFLFVLSSYNNYYSFFEIGTWNGYGSTKCFIEGFKNRKSPYLFYSLECNKDKTEYAKNLYKDIENVFILNEVLFNDYPSDINIVFPELEQNDNYLLKKFFYRVTNVIFYYIKYISIPIRRLICLI